MRTSSRTIAAVALMCVTFSGRAFAQANVVSGVEHLSFDRPESWAMKYFVSATLLNGLQTPFGQPAGSIVIGADVGWLPQMTVQQQRVGFFGTSPNDLNHGPIFVRPQATVVLPRSLALTVAGDPPIRAFGATPRLIAGALEGPFSTGREWAIGWRVVGQLGRVDGAFTCSGAIVALGPDAPGNPEGCLASSSDTVTLRYVGGAIEASRRLAGSRWIPHLSVGLTYVDTTFQVNAQTDKYLDRTRLDTHGITVSASTGLGYAITERFVIAGDVFYSPLTVQRTLNAPHSIDGLFNTRALLTYRFH